MKLKYLLVTASLLLAGCEQAYRYPCQNPANWDKTECKKPICEVNRDCPEYIFKSESINKMSPAVPAPMTPRGDCK